MSEKKYDFEILCPNRAYSLISTSKHLPDHHPLSQEEVIELLNFARDN